MAKVVEISKHSNYKIKVIKDKGTIFFLDKADCVVFSNGGNITIQDNSRPITFSWELVKTPVGNTALEVVTNIQTIIES